MSAEPRPTKGRLGLGTETGAPPEQKSAAASKGAPPEVSSKEADAADRSGTETTGRRRVWMCQYGPDHKVKEQLVDPLPGSIVQWKAASVPREMQDGDPVVYRRLIKGRDRGGIVGTGRVQSRNIKPDDQGVGRFPTEVQEFFENQIIPWDEVIQFAVIHRKSYRGTVLDLSDFQAEKISELLQKYGHLPIPDFPYIVPADPEEGKITVRRDDAQQDYDALGRAPLAMSLAWTLHGIWCTGQGLAPFGGTEPQPDAAGFVAHVDAPWGGGKTSFANLVARILRPPLDGDVPAFLGQFQEERGSLDGLFIPGARDPGGLRDPSTNRYIWDEEARRPWIVIEFNAWLNQHVDPPWWSFYQCIRKGCFAEIRRHGVPTVEHTPEGRYETRRETAPKRLSRSVRLWSRELLWRVTAPQVSMKLLVAFVSLSIALAIWISGPAKLGDDVPNWLASSHIGLVLSIAVAVGSTVMAALTVFADALAPGRSVLGERFSLGSSDPLHRFRRHFADTMKRVRRPILVIMDDIDRCEPKFIVEMTRGLQTLLKSPRVVYLLLGDRKWIEQAFEIFHDDMRGIDVGPEHTFGGRFVEKAIQLSFVLPAIGERKKPFVQEVLTGRAVSPGNGAASEPSPEDLGDQADIADGEVPTKAKPETAEPDATVFDPRKDRQAIRERLGKTGAVPTYDDMFADGSVDTEERRRAFYRAVGEEQVLHLATRRDEAERAIQHRLQPMAPFLPNNPRHIKRIINAIFMYQSSLFVSDEEADERQPGSPRWRQLVVGVVLMIGYPKYWACLTRQPSWADHLTGKAKDSGLTGGTHLERDIEYRALKENPAFVSLLRDVKLHNSSRDQLFDTVISTEVVRWLNRLIPA